MTDTHIPPGWIDTVRLNLRIPWNDQTHRFFEAMARAEGGTAKWNPLNSTLTLGSQWTEAIDYNEIPVRNYKYAIAGICATTLTFIQRKPDGTLLYGHLLNDLQRGEKTAEQTVIDNRAQIGPPDGWGTNPELMLEILKGL